MSSFKEKDLTVRPYGELVAAGIAEVKAAAARERVRPAHDRAAGLRDLRLGRFQRGGVNHHQRIGGPDRRLLREPAAQATVPEGRVVRSVILELPAEHRFIELLGAGGVGRAELDVVDLPVMLARRHSVSMRVRDLAAWARRIPSYRAARGESR